MFFLGSNGKLIKTQESRENIPFVFGDLNEVEFFILKSRIDDTSSLDETAMGVKATIGSLVVVANSVQKEAAAGVDVTTYSAAYTTGGLVIGFQGADNDASSYSATYTIVPGMQFEIGSEDNGTTSVSTAELQMTF